MTAVSIVVIILFVVGLPPLAYVLYLSRHKKSSQSRLRLVGRLASVESPLTPEGFVLLDGELWPARMRTGESVGRGILNVRVVGASGISLEVEPAS